MIVWTAVSLPFKKVFLRSGITEEEFDKYNKSYNAWIVGIITQVIAVIILALLLNGTGIDEIGDGILFVLLVGIAFVFCQTVNMDQGFKRPISFTILNCVLFLSAFITHAIVLLVWD